MVLDFLQKFRDFTIHIPFLSSKPSQVVGVDIGIFSTKVVQLKKENDKAVLETYGEVLNQGYLKEGEGTSGGFLQFNEDSLVSLLRDVIKESNVTSREAVIGIPAAASFLTTFSLPNLPAKEIHQAIPFEARKFIPVPIKDVVLDWDVMKSGESGGVEVLLVAVPQDVISKIKRIAEGAGLALRSMEIESFSVARSLVSNDWNPTAILNIGYQSSFLAISDKGRLVASHNILHGSQEWTRAISRALGVDLERAEAFKREVGLSGRIEEREVASALSSFIDALFNEVERIIAFYYRKTNRKIQKINLTGSGSNLKGLLESFTSRFEIEVDRGNPFSRVVVPAFVQPALREIGPGFSVAVGLAMRELTPR